MCLIICFVLWHIVSLKLRIDMVEWQKTSHFLDIINSCSNFDNKNNVLQHASPIYEMFRECRALVSNAVNPLGIVLGDRNFRENTHHHSRKLSSDFHGKQSNRE
jgi:hypothetical protein